MYTRKNFLLLAVVTLLLTVGGSLVFATTHALPPAEADALARLMALSMLLTILKAVYNWNITRSAKALKVDRVTLYNKIKKFNLKQAKK